MKKQLFLLLSLSLIVSQSFTADGRIVALPGAMPKFDLQYSTKSENFIKKSGYVATGIGGIVGLAGTAYYLGNNPDALSTATKQVLAYTVAGIGGGIIGCLIGRDVADSYTPEAKAMSRMNGQRQKYNNIRSGVSQSRINNVTIGNLTRPEDPQSRENVYQALERRPDSAWEHLDNNVPIRNWIQRLQSLHFKPCAVDYKALTWEQQKHIDRFALESQKHNTALLKILNDRTLPIKTWVENTGDTMDEIRKDRLFGQIRHLTQQISHAQRNASDREWWNNFDRACGSESGIHSKDPTEQKEASFNRQKREHAENSEARDIENRQTRIDNLNHEYNDIRANEVFNRYFNTHPTRANA